MKCFVNLPVVSLSDQYLRVRAAKAVRIRDSPRYNNCSAAQHGAFGVGGVWVGGGCGGGDGGR